MSIGTRLSCAATRFTLLLTGTGPALAATPAHQPIAPASPPVIDSCTMQPATKCPGQALAGARLRGLDLTGANFRGADLSQANLSGADLGQANLRGANLHQAIVAGTNLYAADLTGAIWVDGRTCQLGSIGTCAP
ncbi:MAG: pentapeptide repeat-containing protein [Actinomycetales bacterium]